MPKSNEQSPPKGIRLRHLKIHNFKALDDLELDFPPPEFPGDPDVLVMGSRNGVGKTSVLEACALMLLGAHLRSLPESNPVWSLEELGIPLDFADLLIRAGEENAEIEGVLEAEGGDSRLRVLLERPSASLGVFDTSNFFDQAIRRVGARFGEMGPKRAATQLLRALGGGSPEPFICSPLLYFHSYRRVSEGNTKLGKMVEREAPDGNGESGGSKPTSAFKLAILKSVMVQRGFAAGIDPAEAAKAVGELGQLMGKYAGGALDNPRILENDTIEFRVSPGEGMPSFPFDGLSSGQKEIISTFFLVWLHTRSSPGIVLIDEPELHLNGEWQVGFIRQLHKLAPDNQLIVATHSEDIFGSVEQSRRVFLEAGKGAGHGGK